MGDNEIKISGVENVKTSTRLKKVVIAGEEVDYTLVTRVQFETEMEPGDIAKLHRFLKSDQYINITIWSPQLSMKMEATEDDEQ